MKELVRIKKLKTGEHMMVTPAYAARTKMLKNSGWVVENLPEVKNTLANPIIEVGIEKDGNEIDLLSKDSENLPLSHQIKIEVETKKRGRQPGSTNKPK